MASRHEVQLRREAMISRLRADCRTGRLRVGEILPSVRELGEQYGLSKNVVHTALRDLIDEGLLYSIPTVGTFVGPPPASSGARGTEYYLLLQEFRATDRAMERGFTEEISSHGGATITLELSAALRMTPPREGAPAIAGVYGYVPQVMRTAWGLPDTLPVAQFFGHAADPERTDVVSFDDAAGGRMATQHLLTLGHKKIAFLGLHTAVPDSQGFWYWSRERMIGWAEALRGAGLLTEGLAFFGERTPEPTDEAVVTAAAEIAERGLAARRDITAVVAASDAAALGLIEALNRTRVPKDDWPAIVGFDNLPLTGGRLLTSLSLPFEEIGRASARLLWQRRHGLLTGPPVHERVPMKLLPRLSSKAGWSAKFDFTPILLASRV
jgi:DNA-binding transcriptional regulator YhcF (GntR family)